MPLTFTENKEKNEIVVDCFWQFQSVLLRWLIQRLFSFLSILLTLFFDLAVIGRTVGLCEYIRLVTLPISGYFLYQYFTTTDFSISSFIIIASIINGFKFVWSLPVDYKIAMITVYEPEPNRRDGAFALNSYGYIQISEQRFCNGSQQAKFFIASSLLPPLVWLYQDTLSRQYIYQLFINVATGIPIIITLSLAMISGDNESEDTIQLLKAHLGLEIIQFFLCLLNYFYISTSDVKESEFDSIVMQSLLLRAALSVRGHHVKIPRVYFRQFPLDPNKDVLPTTVERPPQATVIQATDITNL